MQQRANSRKETRTDVEFPPTGQPIYGFFDLAATKDGSLTEDYSFCARWSNLCDGEIRAIVDEMTGHIGDYEYCGRFIDYLKAAEAPAPGQRRLSSPA